MELTITSALTHEEKAKIRPEITKLIIEIPVTEDIPVIFPNVQTLELQSDSFPSDVIFPNLTTLSLKTSQTAYDFLRNQGSLEKLIITEVKEPLEIPEEINITHLEISGDLSKIHFSNQETLMILEIKKAEVDDDFLKRLSVSAQFLTKLSIEESKLKVTEELGELELFPMIEELELYKSVLGPYEPLHYLLKQFKEIQYLDLNNLSNGGPWKSRPEVFTHDNQLYSRICWEWISCTAIMLMK